MTYPDPHPGSQLHPQEQAALFANTDAFFCPHGAHMANSLFMRPGSAVIEMSCGGLTWMRAEQFVAPLQLMQFTPRNEQEGLICEQGEEFE